jgi:hypothetical protein
LRDHGNGGGHLAGGGLGEGVEGRLGAALLGDEGQVEGEAEEEEQEGQDPGDLGQDIGGLPAEDGFRGAAAEGRSHAGVGAGALHEDDEHAEDADGEEQHDGRGNEETGHGRMEAGRGPPHKAERVKPGPDNDLP